MSTFSEFPIHQIRYLFSNLLRVLRGSIFLENGTHLRPLLVYLRSFQQQFYTKIVDFSRNRTQIIGVVGEHVDSVTTTRAQHEAVSEHTMEFCIKGYSDKLLKGCFGLYY